MEKSEKQTSGIASTHRIAPRARTGQHRVLRLVALTWGCVAASNRQHPAPSCAQRRTRQPVVRGAAAPLVYPPLLLVDRLSSSLQQHPSNRAVR